MLSSINNFALDLFFKNLYTPSSKYLAPKYAQSEFFVLIGESLLFKL